MKRIALLFMAALAAAAVARGAGASAQVGQQVTFTVTAGGTSPFQYQWAKNGTSISGATAASYAIAAAQASDAGTYSVTVTNSAGNTNSDTATLDVVTTTTNGGGATAAGAAPDLSKQYCEASLASAWTPPVGQFPQFAIAPIKRTQDPGSHFNDATGIYTVGVGEAGIYSIFVTMRTQDNPLPNTSIGITSGTDNTDSQTFWGMSPGATTDYIHYGADHTNYRHLADGAQIRCNIFVSKAVQIMAYDVVIRRLY